MSKIARDLFLPGDTVASLEMQYLKAGRPGVQEKSSHCMVLSANSCPTNRALITVYCASGQAHAASTQACGLQAVVRPPEQETKPASARMPDALGLNSS